MFADDCVVVAAGKFGTRCWVCDVITCAGDLVFVRPLFAMAAARVRMPANLGEAFSMKLADFMKCCVEDGEDAECAVEAVEKIMAVLKGQHVLTTKRLAHTAVR